MIDENRTLVDLWKEAVSLYPNEPAFIYFGKIVTYKEADVLSDQFARVLKNYGVTFRDRVCFIAPNIPNMPIGFLAVWKIGAIVVAPNFLETSEKIVEMIKLVDPRVIIVSENFREHFEAIRHDPAFDYSDRMLMICSPADYLPPLLKVGYWLKNRPKPLTKVSWKENIKILGNRDLGPFIDGSLTPDSLAVLQFTGGTTGTLKAAMLTHSNLVNNALQALAHVNKEKITVDHNSVFLGLLPFFHVYGFSVCLNLAFAVGATVVLVPKFIDQGKIKKFEQEFKKTGDARFLRKKEDVVDAGVRDLLRILKRHRVSHFPAVPIIYERLVSSQVMRGANLPDLRYGISGAGALDGGTKEEFEFMSGATVVEGYGLSEASPIVSVNPTDLEKQKQGSLGQLVPGTEMKIVGNQLYIRGPQVMAGYWKNSKETQEAFEDGWLKTGDLVGVDERGFLHFKGRDKDMIKVMGDNIYPSEIESIIKKHQSVADAAVIGVADRQFGEKVVACVVLKDGASLTLEELTDYCRNSGLGSLKIPRELRFVLEIPKNIIGKVLKYELKKIIETSS